MREIPRWSKWMTVALTPVPIIWLALFHPSASDIGSTLALSGLVLNVIGAAIIALPDVPRLNQYALSKDFRHAWKTLQDKRQLTPTDAGFASVVELINRQNGRLDYDRTCNFLNVDYKVFGNPNISAGFEEDSNKPPRHTVASWVTMQMWIEDLRDNVRAPGFFIFMSGFGYQLLSYVC
ncbi:hypothetical protein ACERIT_08330 [Halopenitus sp. H-Gu1]|uniref:hypothetical protein n=1 Tax=Halopenitus sp. H-Gu1 TaxID=3242697 RepID=UPI00359E9009